jgi:hypothetical protein
VRRPEALAEEVLNEEALLVRGPPAHERRGALARALERPRRLGQRALPGDRAQVAPVAHHRRGDPLGRGEGLVAEAALVAQPAVVHVDVVARQYAHHLGVVAQRQLHVAL